MKLDTNSIMRKPIIHSIHIIKYASRYPLPSIQEILNFITETLPSVPLSQARYSSPMAPNSSAIYSKLMSCFLYDIYKSHKATRAVCLRNSYIQPRYCSNSPHHLSRHSPHHSHLFYSSISFNLLSTPTPIEPFTPPHCPQYYSSPHPPPRTDSHYSA